ncbi:MAG: TonB-dependent receptor [Bacteroidia bacterium]|nr:TonB-dependent receptor [Bacteroidia bacterium]
MQISTNVRRVALFVFSMVLSVGLLYGQERTITGRVSAEDGPLPGVNVTVQGTTIGAISDVNGVYTLKVPGPTSVLLFSSIGYVTQQVAVGSQAVIDLTLVSDVLALQEVVVTGYSTQRKRDLTGSVGVVETAELTAIPTGQLTSQLQGRASGVTVLGDGRPGQAAKVRIRGFSSFEENDPLYIVDGVPTTDISYLNPNDVETMVVLKDAGAASVYGSRASNGVIVVNTKRGSSGVKVTYDMYTGVQLPGVGPTPDLLTAEEYAQLQWLVYANDGITETHPVYGPSSQASPTMPVWYSGKSTDWYDEVTDNAIKTNHDLTFSSGTDRAKFFAGFGYLDEDGIVKYNYSKRARGRFNSEFTILKDRVKIGENLTVAYQRGNGANIDGENSAINASGYRLQSIIPAVWTGDDYVGATRTWKAGDWGGTGIAGRLGNSTNTLAGLTRGKDNWDQSINVLGNMYLDIKILNGLNFRSSFGGGFYSGYGVGFNFATYENAENTNTASYGENAYWGSNWIWTNQLTYDKVFGDHKITAVAGYEAIKTGMGRELAAQRGGYFSNDLSYRTLTNGASVNYANSSYYTPTALVSIFGKVDYGFRNKYLLSATVRRDGSSKFGPDTRYGIFPAFSAAWRIGDEPFLESLSFLSDLKIRGSWGMMGNQMALSTANQFNLYGGEAATSYYDIAGAMTGSTQGFRPTRVGNADAKWETNVTTDIGVEGAFLNDKFNFVLDWYLKQTKDLLYQLENPGQAGTATSPYINIAEMKNSGFDFELGYRDNFGDLGFNANAELTTYKNEITKIAEGVNYFDQGGGTTRINEANRNMVGHPMSAFFGYNVMGLFQSDAEVAEAPTQDGAAPGFFRYEDVNGDGAITTADRTFIGDPNPAFTYGLNLTFNYKGLDLNTYMYGSQGNDIFNWNKWWIDFWPSFQGQKGKRLLYDSWTPDRTNTDVPMATNSSNFSTNTQVCSYYMEKGSYLRMKNLQLGYTLPASLLNKINVKSLRVYVQTVNLFTISKYSGLDPELGGDDRAFGSDTGRYPNVKQVIFGLNFVL